MRTKFQRTLATAAVVGGALCASALADENLGEAGGYRYVSNAVSGGPGFLNVTVDCPSNRHLLGMGSFVRIVKLQPKDGADAGSTPDDKASMRANFGGGTGTAEALAVCGQQVSKYRTKARDIDPQETLTVKAPCPTGTRVTGGGGRIKDATTLSSNADLNSSFPYDGNDGDSDHDDGWAVRGWNDRPSGRGRLTAYAICADLEPVYMTADSSAPPGTGTTTTASCPDTHFLSSAGFERSDTPGIGTFVELKQTDSIVDGDVVPDDDARASHYNPSASPASVTTYAVCLP
ncbi:MAG: hypothetical protein ACR2G3_12845 [Solirubrobacterales bacterium]